MGNFFKGIAKGLYNIVIIPAWLISLIISAIAGLGIFFMQLFALIVRFFKGEGLSLDLPEDIQAKKMLAPKAEEEKKEKEDDDVEVVVAEIADPGVKYKEAEIEVQEVPKNITNKQSTNNNEDVDFVINEEPTEIEFSNTTPDVIHSPKFENNFEENSNINKNSFEKPAEEEKQEDVIEEYLPKGSDF